MAVFVLPRAVFVQPIALFFEAINSDNLFEAGFNFLLGAFSIYTGIQLWRVATNALRLVKAYFVVLIVIAVLSILTASTHVSPAPSQDNFVAVGFRILIGAAIWWSYFKRSKRVNATYGSNL